MHKILPFILFAILTIISCQSTPNNEVEQETERVMVKNENNQEEITNLLKGIGAKSQLYTVTSKNAQRIVGEKGLIIYYNPSNLSTDDGSPLGDSVDIELIEFIDNIDMLMHNIQTTSNGELLVSGGAYYINMTSNGKQLNINQNGMKVELPKISNENMSLFVGKRDSVGSFNWIYLNKELSSKENKKSGTRKDLNGLDIKILLEKNRIEDEELILRILEMYEDRDDQIAEIKKLSGAYEALLEIANSIDDNEYNKLVKEYDIINKTYSPITLLNFGFINCDRFNKDPSPKHTIHVLVPTDINNARFYAIFHDINSIMTLDYSAEYNTNGIFKGIPENSNITVLGLTVKDTVPYLFKQSMVIKEDTKIKVGFSQVNFESIKKTLYSLKK